MFYIYIYSLTGALGDIDGSGGARGGEETTSSDKAAEGTDELVLAIISIWDIWNSRHVHPCGAA